MNRTVVRTTSTWDPATGLLRTTLQGPVTTDDVRAWRDGLHRAAAAVPDGGRFQLLLDLSGFAPADLDAHRAMRTVVPELLAAHGLRPAFLDLFDEQPEVPVTLTRGVRCVAFANVHHDAAKMADYERRIGTPTQRFFTDAAAAERWLLSVALDDAREG